jgi:hypothetical protein
MVLNLPRNESATKAPNKGSNHDVPDHKFKFSAAVTVDCPKGPVKYVIKFPDIPK